MKRLTFFRAKQAFSLIEVCVAMGIFAFAIVVILGLMGSAMKSTRDSEERIAAANLAALISARYQSVLQDEANGGTGSSSFQWSDFPLPQVPTTTTGTASPDWNPNLAYVDAFGNKVGSDDAVFAVKFISTASGIGDGNAPTPQFMLVKCALQFQWPVAAATNGKPVNTYTSITSFVVASKK